MACSGGKLDRPAPAMDLYRGVMYQSFRAHVKPETAPAVVILSALHGFIDPTAVIAPYDLRMTAHRASEMLADLPSFMDGVTWPGDVDQVFLAGGATYRCVMRAALQRLVDQGCMPASLVMCEASAGIGYQRSELGKYLDGL